MADAKTIARIEKLLRLAAPSSNTTDHERASAAIEAAKLIAEHGLTISDPPPPPKKERRREPAAPYRPPVYTRPIYEPWPPEPWPPESWPPEPIYEARPPEPAPFRYSGSNWRESTVDIACWCVICQHPLYVGERAFHDDSLGWRCYDISCGT